MVSQELKTVDEVIRQLEGLRRDLIIHPPVIVDFSLLSTREDGKFPGADTITLKVTSDE